MEHTKTVKKPKRQKVSIKKHYQKPNWTRIKTAMKQKDLRKRLLYTAGILIVAFIGTWIPIPGINPEYMKNYFKEANSALDMLNRFTGGSFERMSILALSITPYITASIIMQLLTIAIPKLEELQKDGEEGRKKIATYTRVAAVALALLESIAMAVGFGQQGLLNHYNVTSVSIAVVTMTAGSALLIWLGERITDKGIGNGISMILAFNIASRIPGDLKTLAEQFVLSKKLAPGILSAVIILGIIGAMVWFTVLLTNAEHRIPIQHAGKTGSRSLPIRGSNLPVKVNTAGVVPVIFASSLMQLPVVIAAFLGKGQTGLPAKILAGFSQSNWLVPAHWIDSWGLLIYILLTYLFAYFYTAITFNPKEVADNLRKSGASIPGFRPGKPTEEYLTNILKVLIFYGATGLIILQLVPILCSGILGANVSFGGTSLIILVSVVTETIQQIEGWGANTQYKGFLRNF